MFHLARWLTELLWVPCCCRMSRSPPENTSVAGRNSESSKCSPKSSGSKGAMSGPAYESMALWVRVLFGSLWSLMLASVGEQLKADKINCYVRLFITFGPLI